MTTLAEQNRRAWEAEAYAAWVRHYGTPLEYAADLRERFRHKLRHVAPQLGDLNGKRIANPLGSNGRMAVALALAGAAVTVFDISEPNRRYALELAEAAGVTLEYIVGDFGSLELTAHARTFGAVLIDHGVLHYFTDLDSFMVRGTELLRPHGQLVVHEFHPLLKKLTEIEGGKISLKGDYFAEAVEAVPVAYAPFAQRPETLPPSLVRRWTLGEIITAVAGAGFVIERLRELPEPSAPTLPGSFVLTARLG